MKNVKITKIISIAIIFISIIVMLGWFFSISLLINFSSISVKFLTALCFLLSGFTLFFIIKYEEGEYDWAQVVIPITTLIIFLIMVTLLVSVFTGIDTNIEDLFIRESIGATDTEFLGRPSVVTMINFILIALAGILTLFKVKKIKKVLHWLGVVIALFGGVAIIGYILDLPILYFTIKNISNPIALISAFLFILCGVNLIFISKEIKIPGIE